MPDKPAKKLDLATPAATAVDLQAFYLPSARSLPLTRVLRERLLPRTGEVLVSIGERVEPGDIIARTRVPVEPVVVNLARQLQVAPRSVKGLLLKSVGDTFENDEPLAQKKGLFGRNQVFRAPSTGRLLAEHEGEALLELAPVPLDLQANLKGVVSNVMPRYGVVIQASGGLVQGVWGNGRDSYGALKVLGAAREQPLTAELLDVGCLGAIVAVGGTIEEAALKQAESMQVRGIVAGSMPAALREQAAAMPYPIMITEGFGSTVMAAPAYEVLKRYHSRDTVLRAVVQTRWGAQRPELVAPLSAREADSTDVRADIAPPAVPLQPETMVRVCAGRFLGCTGRVIGDRPYSRVLSNGVRARSVVVELDGGEQVWIPINNLEAIG